MNSSTENGTNANGTNADPLIQNHQRKLVQEYKPPTHWLQMTLDWVLVCGLLDFHIFLKGLPFDGEYRVLAILTVLLMVLVYRIFGVYELGPSAYRKIMLLGRSWLIVITLLIAIAFITKTSEAFSREVILLWILTGFTAQSITLLVVHRLQSRNRSKNLRTIIVGSGVLAQHLAEEINRNPWVQDEVIGMVSTGTDNPLPVSTLGGLSDIEEIVTDNKIRRVYLALPMQQMESVRSLYTKLAQSHVDIIWAPDIFSVELLNHSIRELGGMPLISLSETPQVGNNAFLKTLLDYSVTSVALVTLAPVLLITAVCIKLTSPGPVFFRQKRHGWYGEEITVYKFRSMKVHEEVTGKITQAAMDDDRVTKVGRFIRRTSIDELPQLINVLNGSMSIVGPRPHAIAHNVLYGEQIKDYKRRHHVKPGLTGLAQVNGFRGETRELGDMQNRVDYDLVYINNWSIWLDIKIIVKTVFVLFDKNAY